MKPEFRRRLSAGVLVAILTLFALLTVTAFGPGWVYWRSPHLSEVRLQTPLARYISDREARFQDIKEGNASRVIFAHPGEKPTDFSLVYLHGFSASPREISPVMENTAAAFGFNTYLPRLSGHGRSGDLMETLTADELFQDAEEAYQVGKQLGRKTILVGTSTGATLALWLASRHPDIAGLVLISPNLGIRDPRGWLAAGPLGYWIARAVVGPVYQWKPKYAGQENFWSTRYSVNGVRVMTDVVREVERLDFSRLRLPLLVLWTDKDTVVDVQRALGFLHQVGGEPHRFQAVDTDEHVLAGEITSPGTTLQVTHDVADFIHQIVEQTVQPTAGR